MIFLVIDVEYNNILAGTQVIATEYYYNWMMDDMIVIGHQESYRRPNDVLLCIHRSIQATSSGTSAESEQNNLLNAKLHFN